jgi:hypothetical protein
MATFTEKEKACTCTFIKGGPYWHLYTNGKETSLIFKENQDFTFGVNVLAQTTLMFPSVRIIAFTLMDNHIHILASGEKECLTEFFAFFRKRIFRGLNIPKSSGFTPQIKGITDLSSMRNHIVYIHRNGYVADKGHTPYSYPWGTGPYYFGPVLPILRTFKDTTTVERRKMFLGRIPDIPKEWKMTGGYIVPPSFCSIAFGMAMFRDAHQYYFFLNKNIEEYQSLAAELDDSEFLSDSEAYTRILAVLKTDYNGTNMNALTKAQKSDLARKLRHDFRSSNGQIRRILGLSQYEVDSLFPLSAKPK